MWVGPRGGSDDRPLTAWRAGLAEGGRRYEGSRQTRGTSVFVGGLPLPLRGFANIAVEAGVHRYGETGASS